MTGVLLSELTADKHRLALVGLAKNTGKTVALNALLAELQAQGRRVGVTSVGRDGEERDAIDSRIEKPRIELAGESLVATTDMLLRSSGLPHDTLEQTGIRTPLGRVLIARLRGPGTVEVAGPSAAADVRAVSDAMLAHGAEQILIDGAIDRRAASSPDVSDGLVMSTGAVLDQDIEEVVRQTKDAVELLRLAAVSEDPLGAGQLRTLAKTQDPGVTLLVDASGQAHPMPPHFVLTAEPPMVDDFMREGVTPTWLLVSGALPEAFLNGLVSFARRAGQTVRVVVADATKVFLSGRGVEFYASQGVHIQTLHPISLQAITVNPIAPQSHRFDSRQLRTLLQTTVDDVPILDVLHADYAACTARSSRP